MILKRIDINELGNYLDKIDYIAYSDPFAKFALSAYSSRRSFVGIYENDELEAFFPIFERKGNGQNIVEVPLFIYTEIFFLDRSFVINGLKLGQELVKTFGCDVLRLNIYKPNFAENFITDGFQEIFTTMIIPLDGINSFEDYLARSISRNARSKIYKGEASGFEFVELAEKDLPEFYNLYENHVKFLESTPHPIDYFQKIIVAHEIGQNLFMYGARHQGKLVAANLLTKNKDYIEVKFLADDVNERKLFPNNFLYAEMIKRAIEWKVKFIDFGGIPNTMPSNIEFKKSFGAKEYPLYTHYFFRNPWQKFIFKFNRHLLYLKKNPKLVLNKLFLRK